jgi:hypothetical protein
MKRNAKTPAGAVSFAPNEPPASWSGWRSQPLLLLMFAGILLVYLLLPTKNYYWDGIFFAQTIEEAQSLGPQLLHPNHLIYNVLGYLSFRAARAFGLGVRALEVLQILNCVFAALSAYLLFRILLECFKSVYLGAMLTVVFAFSATWWKFATDANSYTPSVLFLLISFYLILPGRKPKPYLLAAVHALSMFFHQLAVLFFPVILLGIWLQTSAEPGKRRLQTALKYSLSAFLITFPLFCYSFYLVTGSFAFRPFFRWITNFSPEHGFTFNFWDNLSYTLRGHPRLFMGGRISFLRDLNGPLIFAMTGVTLILAALFFFKLIRYFRELKTASDRTLKGAGQFRSLRLLTIVWIVCYLIFLFFFIPQNTFYRLFYLPAIIVLVGTFLAPFEAAPNHVRRYRVAIFAALVAMANLTFYVYPYAQVQANPPLALALGMNESLPAGTVVYVATWNSDNYLVRYFNPQAVWRVIKPEMLEKEMRESEKGESVWIDTTMIDHYRSTPEGRAWLETHTLRRPVHELVNSKYKLQFYQLKRDSF